MAMYRVNLLLLLGLLVGSMSPSFGCPPKPPPPTTTTAATTTTEEPGEICCKDREGGRTEPPGAPFHMGISPADNPYSTVCFYYKMSNCIVCTNRWPWYRSERRCCTKALTGAASDIPVNEYLVFFDSDKGVFDLNPLSLTGDNYLTPNQPNGIGQYGWSIHADSTSEQGVTVKGVTVKGDSCWSALRATVRQGTLTHLGIVLDGFLYVKDE